MTPPPFEPPATHARDAINSSIRSLMSQPQHHRRGEEYARLLALWSDVGLANTVKAPHQGSEDGEASCHQSQQVATCMDESQNTAYADMSI
ncbi:hypothetical protein G4Z16_00565 [Streptomyces bathyalis]|uniref:Uncharacterized protein n=1 Tax=Streptomyces bathyalis TaxID=2710756 RepID=A0A7T1T2E6_9ACTN|nr:hypothetical protein [Streptomyces bathyalis]QPP05131.1 hypothetical protein G4Z16_00565 [Streptomyces bathyalis]